MIVFKKQKEMPGAWIVNPKDRGRKSIKGGNIYLNNGEYFEIEIFNPLNKSILSDIKLNGEPVSQGGLIIRPGQRIYLDCFPDTKKKFVFNTYEVEDNDDVKSAILNNGSVEVSFYKEESTRAYLSNNLRTNNDNDWYNNYQRSGYGVPIFSTTSCSMNPNRFVQEHTSNNVLYSSLVETGRIEGGEKSDQRFTEVSMNFEKLSIHQVFYILCPQSLKPLEITKKTKYNDVDLIKKLSDLKDSGILTEDEFQDKKKEILSRI